MRVKSSSPFAPKLFGNAAREHMEKYGTKPEHFAKIAWKNHKHSVNNPYSQFRDEYSLEQIQKSTMIHHPLTKLQCCPTSDGAGCAIVCSERFIEEYRLQDQAVEMVGIALHTDYPSTFESRSSMNLIGADMSKACASEVYK